MGYIREFKTGSGATGVQVCYKKNGEVVKTVHIGSGKSVSEIKRLRREAQGIIDAERTPMFRLDDFNE